MSRGDVWANRRAASAKFGDAFLEDHDMRKKLQFEKHGNVIFDKAVGVNIPYYYMPSAVGSALFYYGSFEAGEIAFSARLLKEASKNPVILDVGANVGTHSVAWAHALPSARIVAFEPAPSNVRLLKKNVAAHLMESRVAILQEAVGAQPGKVNFFETDDAAYSSLRDTGRRPIVASYDVSVETLDGYVQEAKLKAVTLIKIDVEGTEDDVIAGAAKTIARFKPFLFVEVFGGSHSNPDPKRTISGLEKLGYTPYVVSDGLPTRYKKHDDRFYNYLFVSNSYKKPLPATDLDQKRAIDAERLELLDKLTADLTAVEYLNERLKIMSQAAEERLAALETTAQAASDLRERLAQGEARLESVQQRSTAQLESISREAELRRVLLESAAAEAKSASALAESRQQLLLESNVVRDSLNAQVESLRKELAESKDPSRTMPAASPQDQTALLAHIESLQDQLKAVTAAAQERLVALESNSQAVTDLRGQLRQREAELQSLRQTLDA